MKKLFKFAMRRAFKNYVSKDYLFVWRPPIYDEDSIAQNVNVDWKFSYSPPIIQDGAWLVDARELQ